MKIITGEKCRWTRMTSDQLGLTDEFYDLQVPYAVRITPTGEFIHGAPWAASRIGAWNGSHGCTNLNVGPAKWFLQPCETGDVTVTTSTGRRMETWNGTPGRTGTTLEAVEGHVGPELTRRSPHTNP